MSPTEDERDTDWRQRYSSDRFHNSLLPLLKCFASKLGLLFDGNLVFCYKHCENGYALRFKEFPSDARARTGAKRNECVAWPIGI